MRLKALAVLGIVLSLACGIGKGDVDYGVCPDYIACAEATGTPTATIEATYGVDGVCWEEDSEELCRAACEDAMTVLSSTYPEESACLGGGIPQTTDWGVDACRNSIVPGGSGIGSVPANFELRDQNGDLVSLYDFCDRAVLVAGDASWHDAMSLFSSDIASLVDTFGSDFAVVVLIGENAESNDPSASDLQEYADRLPFEAAVLADPGYEEMSRLDEVRGLPTFVLFGRGSVLFETDDRDALEEATVEAALR